jgi:hypothetical protein
MMKNNDISSMNKKINPGIISDYTSGSIYKENSFLSNHDKKN